jgi:hypothetical protein
MKPLRYLFSSIALLGLVGCTSIPTRPSVLALPGSDKTFEQFNSDDTACRGYASGRMTGVGRGPADETYYETQRVYDFAYIQCMYSKGHKVPVSGVYSGAPGGNPPPPPPPSMIAPPAAPPK